jgi:hypothetical protein
MLFLFILVVSATITVAIVDAAAEVANKGDVLYFFSFLFLS